MNFKNLVKVLNLDKAVLFYIEMFYLQLILNNEILELSIPSFL